MNFLSKLPVLLIFTLGAEVYAQQADPFNADFRNPGEIKGMKLVWNDEFNDEGKPDPFNWIYEKGFVRNQELQWYEVQSFSPATLSSP